jgi:hypothetical protein
MLDQLVFSIMITNTVLIVPLVLVGVLVGVAVGVVVGVGLAVFVGVGLAVLVGVLVEVGVGVLVADGVGVLVGVLLGVGVLVGVVVVVGVGDGVGVGVAAFVPEVAKTTLSIQTVPVLPARLNPMKTLLSETVGVKVVVYCCHPVVVLKFCCR